MTGQKRFRILVSDPIHSVCLSLLKEAGCDVVRVDGKNRSELESCVPSVDAWIIRSGTQIDDTLLEKSVRLKVIGRAGVGVDNVDLDSATRRGVLVMNAPAGNTVSTAEHTVAMILALARNLPAASASLRGGNWNRKAFTGLELLGKTLGIIGVGKIGRTVAERMTGFGMTILGFDPVLSADIAERLGIELVEITEIIRRSDFLTVHTPLNDRTSGLLNDESLAACKEGVRIVNCARGGIVDEGALLRALDTGRVAGAALDVYSVEPPHAELAALIGHPHVIATPHIAASTEEAQEKVARQITEQVLRALRGEPVATVVNSWAINKSARPELQPFLDLTDRLGRFSAQYYSGKVDRVVVSCRGEIPQRFRDVLEIAALQGFLSSFQSVPVNLVNAPVLARESGLRSGVESVPPEGYANRVDIRLSGDAGELVVGGTVFGEEELLIVEIDGYRMDIRPEGRILLYQNQDRPGILASVGTVLAEKEINIASLALGRTGPGARALTAISLDEAVPAESLDQIAALEGVSGVREIYL